MGQHYVTFDTPEGRGRVWGGMDDATFERVIYGDLKGVLPRGVHIYHFEDGEHRGNSRRVQAFCEIPLLDIGWEWGPETFLRKLREQQEAEDRAKAQITCKICGVESSPFGPAVHVIQGYGERYMACDMCVGDYGLLCKCCKARVET